MRKLLALYKDQLKKMLTLKGRLSRKTYWIFHALHTVISVITVFSASLLLVIVHSDKNESAQMAITGIGLLLVFIALLNIILYISTTTRRLHDINRTGWWTLWSMLVPFLWVVVFIFSVQPSQRENNRFGDHVE